MRVAFFLLALSLPGACHAAADAEGFAWQQHPGDQVPLGAMLRDEAGRAVTLGSLLGPAPAILDLGYFHCPSLCGLTRADVLAAARAGGLSPGRDVVLVAVSIDPAETTADAAAAKDGVPPDWRGSVHDVTADAATIAAIERAVGFRARWDARFKQFMHPAGVVVLTRTGRVSAYLMGVGFAAGDVRAAVLRAGDGGIAQAALPILLLCFHFDAATGRYTLAIEKVLRLMGGVTVVVLGGMFVLLNRRTGAPARR